MTGNTLLTVVLVLVHPTVTLLRFNHEFIVSKPCIDKCVDKCARQVSPGRVDVRRQASPY